MKIKYIITLTIISFLLNIVWENVQAFLYAGYQSFLQHFLTCLAGTIVDVAITLFVLAFFWLIKKNEPQTIADFLALALIGFFIAIMIEQRALLTGAWSYISAMPIIPWLNVGAAPVMQMMSLLPLSFYLTKLFNQKSHTKI